MSELIQFDGRTVAVIAPEDLEEMEQQIKRLRELLREYFDNDLTDEREYSFLKRVREALGDE